MVDSANSRSNFQQRPASGKSRPQPALSECLLRGRLISSCFAHCFTGAHEDGNNAELTARPKPQAWQRGRTWPQRSSLSPSISNGGVSPVKSPMSLASYGPFSKSKPTPATLSTLGEHDFSLTVDLDHTVVELICNKRVTIAQPHGPGRQRHRVAPGHGVRCVLPYDLVGAVDLNDPIIVRVRNQCVAIVKPTGKSDAAGRAA
jgi:hypothetical protein